MSELTQKMCNAMGAMDIVKVNETMTGFEKLFDNLDVNTQLMDQVFDNVNAGAYNEKDVNSLISQVAEENNMKLEGDFADISVSSKEHSQKVNNGKQQISNSNIHG